jgi:glutamate-1-semialdehyde 2,1-aminomutase
MRNFTAPGGAKGAGATMKKSAILFRKAQELLPGGVNSPVRAFRSVGGQPLFIAKAKGATVTDVDGKTYIDYVSSWGPMIAGHAHPQVVAAVTRAAKLGTSYGAVTESEITLARMVHEAFPSIEMVRMVSSGTEAVMSAIRLARAATGRDDIVKFEGCYHGHSDQMLVKAGSGALTLGMPDSPGVPADLARHTLNLPYNDLGAVRRLLRARRGKIAAVIVEPVAANAGVILPAPGFLEGLREATADAGALLIFDEVITGFRVAYGGAQEYYGVRPDLTCLGKIIGGGLPVGAYGGRRELMEQVAPAGPVYQAGTLSGNPLAMAAGIATLSLLKKKGVYRDLDAKGAYLEAGTAANLAKTGVKAVQNRVGSLSCLFFTGTPVVDFCSAKGADTKRYARYFRGMLDGGVYLAPSQFEASFISLAHTTADLDRTLAVQRRVLKGL